MLAISWYLDLAIGVQLMLPEDVWVEYNLHIW